MVCMVCATEFYKRPAKVKVGGGKYCSISCRMVHKREHFNSIEYIKELYAKGETLRQIADRLECSPTSVKNIMIENGIPRRDVHDRPYASGSSHARWKGGSKTGAHVYNMLRVEGKWYYEHRLIAEKRLGRKLASDEHVHHINMNPKDNRPENLVVLPAKEHFELHAKMRRRHVS